MQWVMTAPLAVGSGFGGVVIPGQGCICLDALDAGWHVSVWRRQPWTVLIGLDVLRSSTWVLWPMGAVRAPDRNRIGHGGVY